MSNVKYTASDVKHMVGQFLRCSKSKNFSSTITKEEFAKWFPNNTNIAAIVNKLYRCGYQLADSNTEFVKKAAENFREPPLPGPHGWRDRSGGGMIDALVETNSKAGRPTVSMFPAKPIDPAKQDDNMVIGLALRSKTMVGLLLQAVTDICKVTGQDIPKEERVSKRLSFAAKLISQGVGDEDSV